VPKPRRDAGEQLGEIVHGRTEFSRVQAAGRPGTDRGTAEADREVTRPISEHLSRITAKFATQWWHWFFFAQPEIPERIINADPDSWYRGDPEEMGPENYREWREATRNPDVVRAMLEDYRAGLTIDRWHEEADRSAGLRVRCPALILWSLRDDLEDFYGDPLKIWRDWAPDIRGHGIDSGHHMAEQAPDALAASLGDFFSSCPTPPNSPHVNRLPPRAVKKVRRS
jgi:hypothetical protein